MKKNLFYEKLNILDFAILNHARILTIYFFTIFKKNNTTFSPKIMNRLNKKQTNMTEKKDYLKGFKQRLVKDLHIKLKINNF